MTEQISRPRYPATLLLKLFLNRAPQSSLTTCGVIMNPPLRLYGRNAVASSAASSGRHRRRFISRTDSSSAEFLNCTRIFYCAIRTGPPQWERQSEWGMKGARKRDGFYELNGVAATAVKGWRQKTRHRCRRPFSSLFHQPAAAAATAVSSRP